MYPTADISQPVHPPHRSLAAGSRNGRPPVAGDSLLEIKTKVIEGRLPKPSDLRKSVPRQLEAICCKAMSLSPSDRYATALDLARDVERHLGRDIVTNGCRIGY